VAARVPNLERVNVGAANMMLFPDPFETLLNLQRQNGISAALTNGVLTGTLRKAKKTIPHRVRPEILTPSGRSSTPFRPLCGLRFGARTWVPSTI
jgi:hypothetical protein